MKPLLEGNLQAGDIHVARHILIISSHGVSERVSRSALVVWFDPQGVHPSPRPPPKEPRKKTPPVRVAKDASHRDCSKSLRGQREPLLALQKRTQAPGAGKSFKVGGRGCLKKRRRVPPSTKAGGDCDDRMMIQVFGHL